MKLAQGEPEDNDLIFEIGGFTFVVSNYVSQRAGEITIDFTARGFVIRSKLNSGAVSGGFCSTG